MRDAKADLEVCEKATPGPWNIDIVAAYDVFCGYRVYVPSKGNLTKVICKADANFIALAREALPWWINRAQELETENKLLKDRLFLKCEEAEKLPNGQCRGFQVSRFDDEPIEQCKNCQEFDLYEPEKLVEDCPEDWDEEAQHDD